MPSDSPSERPSDPPGLLRSLGAALVNATLLLLALVLALALALAIQVRAIVTEGRAALTSELAGISAEVAQMRETAQGLRSDLSSPGAIPQRGELGPRIDALMARLDQLDTTLPGPQTEGRGLALAVIRFVLAGIAAQGRPDQAP